LCPLTSSLFSREDYGGENDDKINNDGTEDEWDAKQKGFDSDNDTNTSRKRSRQQQKVLIIMASVTYETTALEKKRGRASKKARPNLPAFTACLTSKANFTVPIFVLHVINMSFIYSHA
jgi:hypothetical protein